MKYSLPSTTLCTRLLQVYEQCLLVGCSTCPSPNFNVDFQKDLQTHSILGVLGGNLAPLLSSKPQFRTSGIHEYCTSVSRGFLHQELVPRNTFSRYSFQSKARAANEAFNCAIARARDINEPVTTLLVADTTTSSAVLLLDWRH
jgi:hypothetical protein